MRSADVLLRRLGLLVIAVVLGGCATFDGTPPPAPDAARSAPAVSTPVAEAPAAVQPVVVPDPPPAAVPPEVQRAYDSARQALAAGRTADAERAFVALTRSHPELAGPHANLGLIHRQAGRTAEAVAALEKAVALNDARADLQNQLGIAYRSAGKFAKAKASYERSIALDPNYGAALLNLGILYDLYLWDGARALELYDRYLQMSPGDEQVRRWGSDLRNRLAPKTAAPRKEQG